MKKWAKFMPILAVSLVLQTVVALAAEGASYSYTFDNLGVNRESPDPYYTELYFSGDSIGTYAFNSPQGLFAKDDIIYVADTNNNRIVIVGYDHGDATFMGEITQFTGTSEIGINTLNKPNDIFVDDNNHYYISDTQNERVVHLDENFHLVKELFKPDDVTVSETSKFYPLKAVADRSGRVVVLARGYNEGFVQFDIDGGFIGYLGANKVNPSAADIFWKSIATDEQRSQMALFVPTEYNNLYLDHDGFIYATTDVFSNDDLLSGTALPVRRLNPLCNDILIRNGSHLPIGDINFFDPTITTTQITSKFSDVTVLENDVYFLIDKNRGRIFAYDNQGNMLYAFGGTGNKEGYFQYPTAIENMGNRIIVADEKTNGVTVFNTTEYAELIYSAMDEYTVGNYDTSADYWREVLTLNGNYDLAYVGIGRSLLLQEDYEGAMEYFSLQYKKDQYSTALNAYRKEWFEENIVLVVTGVVLLCVTGQVLKYRKRKKLGEAYDDDYI